MKYTIETFRRYRYYKYKVADHTKLLDQSANRPW